MQLFRVVKHVWVWQSNLPFQFAVHDTDMGVEKSARGRERGKERVYRFTAPSASCYQPLFTLRIERCVVLWLLISSLLRVLHSRVKGRAHYRRTSCVLLLESRLRFGLFELRAAGGWKCRKMILSLAVWSWVRGAFMVLTSYLSYLTWTLAG